MRNPAITARRLPACVTTCAFFLCVVGRGQETDSAAGARLFHLHCAECHGEAGQGGLGPDLTRGVYRHGSTDQALYQTIAMGVAGTPMPATSLADPQLWQLVTHVRLLTGTARVTVPGNPAAGEKLFATKGGCTKCHMIRGEGGRLGPDLSHIGSVRSPAHLRVSILRPDQEVSPAYWSVEAVDKNGKTYIGIRMNEDTYSIQIMDMNEDLYSLSKQDLRTFTVHTKKSRMPGYEKVFSTPELDDLVAYLYSLQRKGRQP
jgi:putative heme-binding domain-containing protein